ncbi:MAG: IS66 family transposase [Ruminococcus sp.]|nr:IS66 family transposase [Ruminococcus sp.]
MPIEKIYEKRKKVITPILEKYWSLMENIHAPQASNLQKAVTYFLNQKENLSNVLLDGRLE